MAKAKRDLRSSPPPRVQRIDGVAWLLLGAGLVVALCVFSYDARTGGDLLGPMGARLASELFETLGVAVHVLLASWFVLVLFLLLRRTWLTWTLRLVRLVVLFP